MVVTGKDVFCCNDDDLVQRATIYTYIKRQLITGTVYILIIIAAFNINHKIKRLTVDAVQKVAKQLRHAYSESSKFLFI